MANDDEIVNPFTGTESYETVKRSRVLKDGEQLAELWAATEEPRDFNLIVRLCLWTGCRRSEAGGLRWSEVVDGVWLIPGTRTKNHRPLALPLPRQALAALEGCGTGSSVAIWYSDAGRTNLPGLVKEQGTAGPSTRLRSVMGPARLQAHRRNPHGGARDSEGLRQPRLESRGGASHRSL